MTRYMKDRTDRSGFKGSGIDGSKDIQPLNKPGKYLDAWLDQAAYKDISAKVDKLANVNGGFSGKVGGPDHSNRADRLRSDYPSKALGKEGNYRGVKGRVSYK